VFDTGDTGGIDWDVIIGCTFDVLKIDTTFGVVNDAG